MMYPLNDEGRGGTIGKLYWLLEGLKTVFKGQFGVEFDL